MDSPEYESAAAVTNLGIFDINWMLEYAWYCDEYAMDTISAGVVILNIWKLCILPEQESNQMTPPDNVLNNQSLLIPVSISEEKL